MKKSFAVSISAMTLAAVFSVPALASDELPGNVEEAGTGIIGLGAISKPDYEGSEDNTTSAAPFGRYRWASGRYVGLGGTAGSESAARVKVNLISSDISKNWTMGPLLQYRLERDDDMDNGQVKRMKKIDAATELGAFLDFRSGPWAADLSVAADVSDEHDGYLMYLGGSYDLVQNSTMTLALGVHATWADADYMDTYFGVNASNVGTSGLPFFKADDGFKDVGASLTAFYRFNSTWGMAGKIDYTSMMNDAEDSPLVDGVGDQNQLKGVVAVTYSF